MTKKISAIVLCLFLIFSLSCCTDKKRGQSVSSGVASYEISQNESDSLMQSEQSSQATTTSDKASSITSSKPITSSVTSQEKPPKAPDLSKISCRKASEIKWQSVKVTVKACKTSFQFEIPSDWSLSKFSDGGFEILRSGKKIGTVLAEDTSYGETLDADYTYSNDHSASVYNYVNWSVENNRGTLYRQLVFSTYPQNSQIELYIILNYNELDDEAVGIIAKKASTYEASVEFVAMDKTNGSKKILILGNSFVASSQIGDFLRAMLTEAGSEYSVKAISIGGANVQTFVDREDIMQEIKNGEYCYVFQCGFYSSIAVNAFWSIKDYCEISDTIPVLFPAHNENPSSVSHAKGQFNDTIFLDWQGEINAFIKSGIDRFDFCYDDGNDHSKPLAGYVGAHMIYRSLFNEVPPAEISGAPLSMENVRYFLGDYIETGIVPGSDVRPAFLGKDYVIA